jgi:hypothetical protein
VLVCACTREISAKESAPLVLGLPFVSIGTRRRVGQPWTTALFITSAVALAACGDSGFFPGTVDPGSDFAVADIVFDQNYFYCKVEPVLFANNCGPGDPAKGDTAGGCHFNATAYRLTRYMPLVGESCTGLVPGASGVPASAQGNYQTSQARMKEDPDIAPLLQRPTAHQTHPRQIFDLNSPDADVIRQWATKFSSR